MKAILGLVMATVLITSSQATPSMALRAGTVGPIVLVVDGCGRDYHRNGYGRCVPNWREWEHGWRACPPGWHLGSEGRRCWPN